MALGKARAREQAGAGSGVHNGWMGFPSGPVTLLFTEIEGGIGLWEADPRR